ncbi:nucleotide sugar dehydrogenase [Kitasatospora sp. NPDC048545]|uniref:nucleotide sugar dehydrogenase n=1 Tax=Kitasatospora sp. NPDC048545 TaxID=3157208 RepID=UPI0033EECE6C
MDDLTGTEVAIWGLGLIGYSLGGELARAGRRCLIMDIDAERVSRLNRGELPFGHLPELPHGYGDEVRAGLLRATAEPARVLTPEHSVQVLCIPTEADGGIDDTVLREVVGRIAAEAQAHPLHLVIESTVAPGWIAEIVHPTMQEAGLRHGIDYHVGASPRRDWLTAPGHTMASIPKIIGGDSPAAVALLRALYGPVCDELVEAPDAQHASLVKVVENYFRYRGILLANELGAALPGYDIASVLRLAGTKWNMPEYHPSLGIGGYCVPLAKDYLAAGNGLQSLAMELEAAEEKLFTEARNTLRAHGGFRSVALLGLAYAPGMKVHTRSPSVRLAHELAEYGVEVFVHDPLYTDAEIERITGARPLRFPEGLASCDSVVVMTGHSAYLDVSPEDLAASLSGVECVVDNLGVWRDREFPAHLQYLEVGGKGYFAPARPEQRIETPSSGHREFLVGVPADRLAEMLKRVTSIDRRYLTVDLAGRKYTVPQLAAHLDELLTRPIEVWPSQDVRLVCALYAIGSAEVRLEQVGISVDLGEVVSWLRETHAHYLDRLEEAGEPTGMSTAGRPWWELADELPVLRHRIDRHYMRLLEIDGMTYHRRELLIAKRRFALCHRPEPHTSRLAARYPDLASSGIADIRAFLREATLAELDQHGHPMGLLELVMEAAAEDPRHPSDHATLMCPRGTRIGTPGSFVKDDFGIYVVFNRDFQPDRRAGTGDFSAIRKAMYAHHAAKKLRIAKKTYGPDDQYISPGLSDDLGARGLFFNEHAHHRGHVVAGVSTALRSLMDLDILTPSGAVTVRGLTDWRLSRADTDPAARYTPDQYPSFHAYGDWARVVVATAIGNGCVLPSMIGEWR